jgi:hypothetical protein
VREEEKKAEEQWKKVLGDRFRSSARNIKPEDIPEELTPEVIDILIEMARAFPDITGEWAAVSKVLEQRGQLRLILDKVQSLERKERELQRASMTEEEKRKEAEQWKKVMDDPEPKFYGNMGEPENAEQYKMKYGHYPPGYESDK